MTAKQLLFILLFSPLWGQEDILVGLTVMDVVTTHYILSTGGMELNPLLPAENLGALAGVKLIITYCYLKTKPPKKQIWVIVGLISTAVINNLWQIHKWEQRE